MSLAERVLQTIRRHGMLAGGRRVLVALSGGPDSTALTHILRELEARGHLQVAGAAHLNHGLRAGAGDDEAFCRAFAEALPIPFRAERADVGEAARGSHTSVEDAARTIRYAFFDRVADELGADAIATGHTRDDQAETFLLRLVRGAGSRGLAGIQPVAGRVIRPLLDVGRDELKTYLAAGSHRYCEDETNRNLAIPRNRVRHELLPYLRREFSPAITDVLAREAGIAREDEDHLRREAIKLVESLVLRIETTGGAPDQLVVDATGLAALHPALAARVAQEVLRAVSGGFVGFEHVRRLLDFARDGADADKLTIRGRLAVRRGPRIVFDAPAPEPFSNSFQVSLSIPGDVVLERQGWVISAAAFDDGWAADVRLAVESRGSGPDFAAALSAGRLALPLSVRSRRPGDRFSPAGLGGKRKKLQDFFVDRKVPRAVRDTIPLVVDADDRIVWIVGHALAGEVRVTDPSQGVILLKARRLGGQG